MCYYRTAPEEALKHLNEQQQQLKLSRAFTATTPIAAATRALRWK
jgi:hypothetical protein